MMDLSLFHPILMPKPFKSSRDSMQMPGPINPVLSPEKEKWRKL